ncbi:undecaprenyl-diphosphate phosphatase [Desulfuromonas acetoxidans]|uniref:Undecaprenyl-diphosphatase n=1 Tax=Desulfuromonas acetoxidans (strain DSM 684 / 11070) TaxID=281689 RepID=Q1K3E9_DESA6|nr:undecaprenyl-diphosphate phosphatase [Desulfuromonas acetoxidans]EAT17025.1 Bacitracin resistance protein BacA [Desulfuromonas acetoxidans DSM 684]MBF0645165.1 undecaprenyl-diphosphate phosphatase [Desulfuromonas acetoxidans]NVD24031.1 undecaprenyl-diphosphate phosphatase [Desulfuromonas acetoxidans]NVE16327.1 undecaprenyl-diphosphate phosphatase [Desulfuromonas acetoxidans]
MNLIHALLLGLLQGATEFLPVSSSGHLAIAQYFIKGFEQPGVLFDVVLHCGTLCAVLIYFWKDVCSLLTAPWASGNDGVVRRRLLWLIIAGSVPTAIIGLTFKDALTSVFHNIPLVCAMLLVTGTILFAAERWRRGARSQEQLTLADALITGLVQGFAILPGISRSGSTIAALLFRGVDGAVAARFSFLLSMPAVAGATLISLKDLDGLAAGQLPLYLAGGGMAFVSGLLSIHLLMAVVRKRRLAAFALYCWGAGAVFFMLS